MQSVFNCHFLAKHRSVTWFLFLSYVTPVSTYISFSNITNI